MKRHLTRLSLLTPIIIAAFAAAPAQAQRSCGAAGATVGPVATFGEESHAIGDIDVQDGGADPANTNDADWLLTATANVDVYASLKIPAGTIVRLKAGAILNVYGDVVNQGYLFVEPGATINFYGKTWENATANTTPGGTINFNGDRPAIPASASATACVMSSYSGSLLANQNLDGGNVPMDVAVHLQNTLNVRLINSAARIEGSLSWDVANGDLLLGNYDLIFTTNGTQAGYQANRFAVTNGSGHVVKENYTGSWTFPVGIAEGDYTPAAISNASANTMHVLVQAYATSTSVEKADNGIDRTLNIYADNATGNSSISLQHNRATSQPAFGTATSDNEHFVTRYSSLANNNTGDAAVPSLSPWQSNTPAAANASPGTLTSGTPIANSTERQRSYTDFATSATDAIAYYSKSSNTANPLPITLISFSGIAKDCKAVLNWATSQEYNFDRFEVEYSNNGSRYTLLGTVSGTGTTGGTYTYTHSQPAGKGYYRLRMIDKGGALSYSSTLSLATDCAPPVAVTLYPNPATGSIRIGGLATGNVVMVYAANGQLVASRTAVATSEQLDVSSYANGMYQVIVTDGMARLAAIKLIKQ